MAHSISLRFQSERFDYSSELPPDYNAGSRFYGKDVAVYLSAELSSHGCPASHLDEDWGWLVFSTRGAGQVFEIAVYNLAEHGEGGRPGVNEWAYGCGHTKGGNYSASSPGTLKSPFQAALKAQSGTP